MIVFYVSLIAMLFRSSHAFMVIVLSWYNKFHVFIRLMISAFGLCDIDLELNGIDDSNKHSQSE